MLLLQLSSAQGPAECELAVTRAFRPLHHEAQEQKVHLDIVEQVAGKAQTLIARF